MRIRTWVLIVVTALLWAGLNIFARPGTGQRVGSDPPVFELELYFGMPATYRAELWESDDPRMFKRDHESFVNYDPSKEMKPRGREFSRIALAVDVSFTVALLIMTAVAGEAYFRRDWRRGDLIAVGVCAAVLSVLYLVSGDVSVSL